MDEAELQTIPFGHNIVGWRSLLNHCKEHGNVKLAQRCFQHVVTADQREAAGYVLLSQTYCQAGLEGSVNNIEYLRKCANAWKKPAKAVIEVDNRVHDFHVGSIIHPQIDGIHAKLKKLGMCMVQEGHMPQ